MDCISGHTITLVYIQCRSGQPVELQKAKQSLKWWNHTTPKAAGIGAHGSGCYTATRRSSAKSSRDINHEVPKGGMHTCLLWHILPGVCAVVWRVSNRTKTAHTRLLGGSDIEICKFYADLYCIRTYWFIRALPASLGVGCSGELAIYYVICLFFYYIYAVFN